MAASQKCIASILFLSCCVCVCGWRFLSEIFILLEVFKVDWFQTASLIFISQAVGLFLLLNQWELNSWHFSCDTVPCWLGDMDNCHWRCFCHTTDVMAFFFEATCAIRSLLTRNGELSRPEFLWAAGCECVRVCVCVWERMRFTQIIQVQFSVVMCQTDVLLIS